MSATETKKATVSNPEPQKKQGFLSKMVSKMDASLKQKADEKAKQGSCCGTDSKGNKCC